MANYISIQCSTCNKRYKLDATNYLNKTIKFACRNCNEIIRHFVSPSDFSIEPSIIPQAQEQTESSYIIDPPPLSTEPETPNIPAASEETPPPEPLTSAPTTSAADFVPKPGTPFLSKISTPEPYRAGSFKRKDYSYLFDKKAKPQGKFFSPSMQQSNISTHAPSSESVSGAAAPPPETENTGAKPGASLLSEHQPVPKTNFQMRENQFVSSQREAVPPPATPSTPPLPQSAKQPLQDQESVPPHSNEPPIEEKEIITTKMAKFIPPESGGVQKPDDRAAKRTPMPMQPPSAPKSDTSSQPAPNSKISANQSIKNSTFDSNENLSFAPAQQNSSQDQPPKKNDIPETENQMPVRSDITPPSGVFNEEDDNDDESFGPSNFSLDF